MLKIFVFVITIGLFAPVASAQAPEAGSTVEITRFSDKHVGAGVQIEPGLVLTAAHVVRSESTVRIVDDQGRTQVGNVVAVNTETDFAFIAIRSYRYIAVSALVCRLPPVGLLITIVGHPFGETFQHMQGKIGSRARALGAWPSLVLINHRAMPGMSGGPVFTSRGQVAAIVVAAFDSKDGRRHMLGAIPAVDICGFVPKDWSITTSQEPY